MENKKVVAIIQARVGSTRLPRKVLKEIQGKTVLYHVIERIRQSNCINQIIIATSNLKQDDDIVKEAEKLEISCFRGSETNVLSRYYNAALYNNADIIVRITSDCPLIDPNIIDEMIKFYLDNSYSIVSNASMDSNNRTYPRGLDTEIFSFNVLNQAFKSACESYQLEHVTPYIYENNKDVYYYKNNKDYSKYRLTLDTIEDFKLIETIYKMLYKDKHDFYLNDIVKLMEDNPKLIEINKDIDQKKIK